MTPQAFNLDTALTTLGQGLYAVAGHICFEAGLYGLATAFLIAVSGLIVRSTRYGVPLLVVSRKLALFCSILALPGALILAFTHQLPAIGAFKVWPLAYVIFWTWISLHLAAEEFNFEFF
jgi:hypothetical protein